MNRMILQMIAVYIVILSFVVSAQDSVKTSFMFWSRLTMGQVVSAPDKEDGAFDVHFKREWLETIDGGIKVTRKLTPSLTGRLNLGVVVNVATVNPSQYPTNEHTAKKVTPALLDACLEYRSGGFLLELGYFPFKYNPQSTNLGEYLFRSGTYPGWLISGFEHSIDKPKLAGVHTSYSFGSLFRLKQDLIVNTEIEALPYRDINFTYIVSPSVDKIVDIGLGVELARLIVLDPKKTTIGLNPTYKRYEPKIGYFDTTTGETIKYTFKGTKLMGRASLDIKALFGGGGDFFGREDLKIYGEMALLGVKNYPGWYNDPIERMPKMLGINWFTNQFLSYCVLPGVMAYGLESVESKKLNKAITIGTPGVIIGVGSWFLDRLFNINSKLDIISIEIEHYPSPYVNAQDNIWKGSSAVPYIAGRPASAIMDYRNWNESMAVHDDDIRWSVYAAKNIGNHVRLSAQAACDHTPKNWYTPWPAPQSAKYSDILSKTSDWYFMMRMSLFF